MRQFLTIAANAFMELIRQPVFLLLMTGSVLFEIFLAVPYYFAFGDEPKLVENCALAVMLLAGLFGAVLSASSSLAREIRSGTALAVLSKPVGRAQFLLAKFAGLAAALTLLTYVNMIGVLIASRMAFDAYGKTDLPAHRHFRGGHRLAYALAGFSNFFLRRPFVSDAVFALVVLTTLAAFLIFQFTTPDAKPGHAGAGGLAAGAGGHPDPVRAVDSGGAGAGLFDAAGHDSDAGDLLGDFFAGADVGLFLWPARGQRQSGGLPRFTPLSRTGSFSGSPTRLDTGKSTFHWGLCRQGVGYVVCYAGAALAVGAALFEERELS